MSESFESNMPNETMLNSLFGTREELDRMSEIRQGEVMKEREASVVRTDIPRNTIQQHLPDMWEDEDL